MATFTVTNLFNAGAGSLRNAIFKANTASTTDDIAFNPSLSGGTIGLTSGELTIRDDLTINGLGADLLSVDAGGNSRVFNVDDGDGSNFIEVAINRLTITGGDADLGGGIINNEDLTVTNSTISGNSAEYLGGGIDNEGYLTVTNSTISGNGAQYGGGILNSNGTLTVTNSTISDNSGGGILNTGDATVTNSTISSNSAVLRYSGGIENLGDLTVTNSTISGNSGEDGGGIYTRGDLTVTNSTISGNSAARGGGIYQGLDSNLTVTNSTISGNTADSGGGIYNNIIYRGNVYGTATVTSSIIAANTNNEDVQSDDLFTSGGNNLIGNGDGATGFMNGVDGDIVGTTANPIDPLLGSLQNNGGPTQTQALLTGSPAINAGSNPLNLEFDQRGPGFNRVVGAETDIGAYEVVPEPDSTLGVLGVAVLGVVLLRKRHRLKKNNPI